MDVSEAVEFTLENRALGLSLLPGVRKIMKFVKGTFHERENTVHVHHECIQKAHHEEADEFNLLVSSCLQGETIPNSKAEYILDIICSLYDKRLQSLPKTPGSSQSTRYIEHVETKGLSENRRFVVIGSLHGQLKDLTNVLRKYGSPSRVNAYIFNGNIIHGPNSSVVLLLIFYLKCLFPTFVFINRGPYEITEFYEHYGFRDALISQKYTREIRDKIDTVLRMLPLITIVDQATLVMCGGPSPDLTKRMVEELSVPLDELGRGSPVYQMMWSRPKESSGFEKTHRVVGFDFGPNETKAFLKEFGVKKLVRSYGILELGYSIMHKDRCISSFCASNYKKVYGNKSSAAIISHDGQTEIYQNEIPGQETLGRWALYKLSEYNQFMISELIMMEKPTLAKCFEEEQAKYDIPSYLPEGHIPVPSWIHVMKKTIGPAFPWKELINHLVPRSYKDYVDWRLFLSSFHISKEDHDEIQKKANSIVVQKMLGEFSSSGQLFDKISEGFIDAVPHDVFAKRMKEYAQDINDTAIGYLLAHVDKNRDGLVSRKEFIAAFDIAFHAEYTGLSALEIKTVKDFYSKLLADFQSNKQESFKAIIKKYKEGGEEFNRQMIFELGSQYDIALTDKQIHFLCSLMDSNGDGIIEMHEFIESFAALNILVETSRDDWRQPYLLRAAKVIHQEFKSVRNAFLSIDEDGSGTISWEEVRKKVAELNRARTGEKIPDQDVEILMNIMDRNQDGVISYDEFRDTFIQFVSAVY